MNRTLEDKVILVTGGARGLGAALCHATAAAGAHVVIADRREALAAQTCNSICASGGAAEVVAMDLRQAENIARGVHHVAETYGRIDAVINNAGIDVTLPLAELHVEQWREVIDVNLHAPFLVAKFAQPHLRESRGHIVNICSTAAKRAWPNA